MATEVKVPTTGNAGEPAVVLEWNVAAGDTVAVGDVVATLETAKSTVEVDSPVDGVVVELRYAEGDEAPEYDVLLVIGAPGETVSSAPTALSTPPSAPSIGDTASATVAAPSSQGGPMVGGAADMNGGADRPRPGRISISPRARRMAKDRDLDIETITGSGPFGRIVIADIEATAAATPATSASADTLVPQQAVPAPTRTAGDASARSGRVRPVRGARKVTAQRMHASTQGTAPVTLTRYATADTLLSYAQRVKTAAAANGRGTIGINDLLLFAVARTLPRHPSANSWFAWDGITEFDQVDLGFAVDTGSALLVPVIREANTLTLTQLATAAHHAIDRARAGHTSAEEMSGGTFTVSNLGGAGIHWFTPVLNLPQTCILGVGATHRASPDAPALLPLSLTFDHRAIDGAAAAALLGDLAAAIEFIDTLAAF